MGIVTGCDPGSPAFSVDMVVSCLRILISVLSLYNLFGGEKRRGGLLPTFLNTECGGGELCNLVKYPCLLGNSDRS